MTNTMRPTKTVLARELTRGMREVVIGYPREARVIASVSQGVVTTTVTYTDGGTVYYRANMRLNVFA